MGSENNHHNRNNGKTFVDRASEWFEKFGMWCYDHRIIVVIIFGLIICGSLYLASTLRIDNSQNSFYELDDPVYATFVQYQEDFGSDDSSYIVYDAPEYEYGPWNIDVMRKISKLTKAIEDEVPFVKKITSLSNAEFLEGRGDELVVYNLLDNFPEKQDDLLAIRDKVYKKPMFIDMFVSRDKKYAAFIIKMEKSCMDPLEEIMADPARGSEFENLYPYVSYKKIEDILKRSEYSGINFHHAGVVPMNSAYNKTTKDDSSKLTVYSIALLFIILFYFFKNIVEVIAPILAVLSSLLITLGFLKLVGWDFDMMATILPTFILVVGVAASVHIVSDFRSNQIKNMDTREAARHTIYILGVPCLFTSFTDIAGFLSMGISPVKAISHFAVYSSFGALTTFVLSISFLIMFLSLVRKKPSLREIEKMKNEGRLLNSMLEKFAQFDFRYKYPILAVTLIVAAISIYGLFQLKVDTYVLKDFPKNMEVRKATELIDRVMGGSGGYSYLCDTKKKDGIIDPDVLRSMESIAKAAEKESWVIMKTYSIVDLIKDINMTFHGGDPKYYVIPDNRDLIAQYLLLYESSGGDELRNYISADYSKANIEIRGRSLENSRYAILSDKMDSFVKSIPDLKFSAQATGMGVLYLTMNDYVIESQVNGFWLAFIGIAIMMCFLFKSIRLGLLGMIPNVLPIAMTLGLMGLLNIRLDFTKVLIGCVSIGIAVDDTIHMVTRCHHEYNICGNYKEAILISVKDVGRAVYITTLVLISGFLLLISATMDSLGTFGILVAFTLGTGLIIELFLTPVLLYVFKPYGPEFKHAS